MKNKKKVNKAKVLAAAIALSTVGTAFADEPLRPSYPQAPDKPIPPSAQTK